MNDGPIVEVDPSQRVPETVMDIMTGIGFARDRFGGAMSGLADAMIDDQSFGDMVYLSAVTHNEVIEQKLNEKQMPNYEARQRIVLEFSRWMRTLDEDHFMRLAEDMCNRPTDAIVDWSVVDTLMIRAKADGKDKFVGLATKLASKGWGIDWQTCRMINKSDKPIELVVGLESESSVSPTLNETEVLEKVRYLYDGVVDLGALSKLSIDDELKAKIIIDHSDIGTDRLGKPINRQWEDWIEAVTSLESDQQKAKVIDLLLDDRLKAWGKNDVLPQEKFGEGDLWAWESSMEALKSINNDTIKLESLDKYRQRMEEVAVELFTELNMGRNRLDSYNDRLRDFVLCMTDAYLSLSDSSIGLDLALQYAVKPDVLVRHEGDDVLVRDRSRNYAMMVAETMAKAYFNKGNITHGEIQIDQAWSHSDPGVRIWLWGIAAQNQSDHWVDQTVEVFGQLGSESSYAKNWDNVISALPNETIDQLLSNQQFKAEFITAEPNSLVMETLARLSNDQIKCDILTQMMARHQTGERYLTQSFSEDAGKVIGSIKNETLFRTMMDRAFRWLEVSVGNPDSSPLLRPFARIPFRKLFHNNLIQGDVRLVPLIAAARHKFQTRQEMRTNLDQINQKGQEYIQEGRLIDGGIYQETVQRRMGGSGALGSIGNKAYALTQSGPHYLGALDVQNAYLKWKETQVS